jgi:hypothetical protein
MYRSNPEGYFSASLSALAVIEREIVRGYLRLDGRRCDGLLHGLDRSS